MPWQRQKLQRRNTKPHANAKELRTLRTPKSQKPTASNTTRTPTQSLTKRAKPKKTRPLSASLHAARIQQRCDLYRKQADTPSRLKTENNVQVQEYIQGQFLLSLDSSDTNVGHQQSRIIIYIVSQLINSVKFLALSATKLKHKPYMEFEKKTRHRKSRHPVIAVPTGPINTADNIYDRSKASSNSPDILPRTI